MNELEYVIYQALLSMDLTKPERMIYKDIKKQLDTERVEYDKDLLPVLVDFCLEKILR